MARLEGLSIVIVGGTGGIGLASARKFLDEGARVVVAGHMEQAGALADAGLHGSIWEFTADASDEADVAALFAFAIQRLGGRLDVLFHVAGVSGRRFGDGALHECSADGWDRVFQINARSVFLTNREAVQIMRGQPPDSSRGRGAILNVGSVVDRSPAPAHFGTVGYAASKAAVRALTMASAARYAPDRIRFNLIEPGLVATPMARRALGDESLQPYLRSKMPLSSGAIDAASIADAAVFLASHEASSITGAVLTIDGGWSLSEGQLGDSTPPP